MDEHDNYMKQVIALALKGSGFVNPSPLEAALVVRAGEIIASLWRSHNQIDNPIVTQVLQKIPNNEGEAWLYLNMEPKIEAREWLILEKALRNQQIKKAFIGLRHPHPAHTNSVISKMMHLGIEVIIGPLEGECGELNEIYAFYCLNNTPFVFVKWAMTLDGKLASVTGDSKWISSEGSLEFVHHLRQRVAAIMVGEGTVRIDNPSLNTRLEGVVVSNPLRVIVSTYGDIEQSAHVLEVTDTLKTLIMASENLPFDKEMALLKRGVQIVKLPEVNGHLDFNQMMKVLGRMGIDSLYIEGGSSILGAAFESGIVHKVYAAIAPKIIGGKKAISPVGGEGIPRMNDAIKLKHVTHEIIGDDVIIKGYIHQ